MALWSLRKSAYTERSLDTHQRRKGTYLALFASPNSCILPNAATLAVQVRFVLRKEVLGQDYLYSCSAGASNPSGSQGTKVLDNGGGTSSGGKRPG